MPPKSKLDRIRERQKDISAAERRIQTEEAKISAAQKKIKAEKKRIQGWKEDICGYETALIAEKFRSSNLSLDDVLASMDLLTEQSPVDDPTDVQDMSSEESMPQEVHQ